MSELHTEVHGHGDPVVLVHGSLATGAEEWTEQLPLAEEGFRLVVADRRGYGGSPPIAGEDYERDAEDIAGLLDGGAHLVAHSYGGLGAMVAAAQHPASTWSLTLLEPPAFTLTADAAAASMVGAIRALDELGLTDEEWLARFFEVVGTDPDVIPAEARDEVMAMVPLVRRGRPPWEDDPPMAALASAPFPKLVVSGGHSKGFEAICDQLAGGIGASRAVVQGAGHEIQFAGAHLNEVLLDLWRRAPQRSRESATIQLSPTLATADRR